MTRFIGSYEDLRALMIFCKRWGRVNIVEDEDKFRALQDQVEAKFKELTRIKVPEEATHFSCIISGIEMFAPTEIPK